MLARWQVVDENFTQRVQAEDFPPAYSETRLAGIASGQLLDWFDSQVKSRHLDIIARELKEKSQSFYTIGSSGHEGNAILGSVFKQSDPAFLHYRSGGFFIQRAKESKSVDPVKDILLSLVCAKADPICSGRHKVFGSKQLNIIPQTSTIASHSPKALGAALALAKGKRLKIETTSPSDAVVLCSFGDASFNHSTLQGSLNAACWLSHARIPVPLVFICEDNGIGVSTQTPKQWIEEAVMGRKGIEYIAADGLNLTDIYHAGIQARKIAAKGIPVFLHLKLKRLLGHAGSDIESHYWSRAEIEKNEADDPLLHSARILIKNKILQPKIILARYESVRETVRTMAQSLVNLPKLNSKQAVMEAIVAPEVSNSTLNLQKPIEIQIKHRVYEERLSRPLTLAQGINCGLLELMARVPEMILFGEDVAKKGGVYRVTADLQKTFGQARVFDTLLDEQTILGMGIGAALEGFLPVVEIQFLAFIHNAIDQIRGEAATLSFFSNGQYTNPMIIRLPGLAYQKGFGGHFHNDNAIAFLREIPGVVVACPANASQAVKLLRTCTKLAFEKRQIIIFLEPIALYHEKDLYEKGDGLYLSHYPEKAEQPIGMPAVEGDDAAELVVISYGNGILLSKQAIARVKQSLPHKIKLVDLCWLSPLPLVALKELIKKQHKILIVDECRQTGSVSEQLMTWLYEQGHSSQLVKRVCGEDCFIPLGESWQTLLPSVEQIEQAIHSVVGYSKTPA